MERIKRNLLVIGLMALAIGVVGYGVAWAGPDITNASVVPSVVSPGTPVVVAADITSTDELVNWPIGAVIDVRVDVSGPSGYELHTGPFWYGAGIGAHTYLLNWVIDTTGLLDGDYTVNIAAMEGGFSWDPFTPNHFNGVTAGTFRVDNTGPVIANAAVLDNAVPAGTPVIVTADISDPSGVTDIRVDVWKGLLPDGNRNYIIHTGPFWNMGGVNLQPFTWTIDTTGYTEGDYNIDIAAMDGLFSWGPFTPNHINGVTVSFKIDNPPVVTITHPQDGNYAAASLNVSGTAWDTVDGALPVEVSINPVVLQSDASGNFGGQVVGPSTGNIVISAKAIDSAGNVGSDSVTILRVHDNRK